MCGLAGVLSSDLTKEKVKIFQSLMVVSTLRGTIGAGIAMVPADAKDKVDILKHETAMAAELVHDNKFYTMTLGNKAKDWCCLMGHARAPTSSGFDVEDTHPFVARHIIGMHNGHMKTVNDRVLTDKEHDSKVLFDTIGNIGVAEALKRSIGAYALTMFNKQTKRLMFVRNQHRPLHFCMVEGDAGTLFWASEPYMLQLAVGRAVNAKLHHYTLPPMELISFPVYNTNINWDDRELIRGGSVEDQKEKDKTPTLLIEHKPDGQATYKTTNNHYFTRTDLLALLQKGCSNCNQPATFMEYVKGDKEIVWFESNEFMCAECLTHDQTARDYITAHGCTIPNHILSAAQTAHH